MLAVVDEDYAGGSSGLGTGVEFVQFIQRATLKKAVEQRDARDAGEGGFGIQEVAQQIQAERFAGLGLRRMDPEIGSGGEEVMTLGAGAPEGEERELVLVADQMAADERCYIVQGLHTGDDGDLAVLGWLRALHRLVPSFWSLIPIMICF